MIIRLVHLKIVNEFEYLFFLYIVIVLEVEMTYFFSQVKLEKHASQKDYATGFGGKYGVQEDRKDKVRPKFW